MEISRHAARLSEKLKDELTAAGVTFMVDSPSNQQFPILPDRVLEELRKKYSFEFNGKADENHSAVRFCTSWATKEENIAPEVFSGNFLSYRQPFDFFVSIWVKAFSEVQTSEASGRRENHNRIPEAYIRFRVEAVPEH